MTKEDLALYRRLIAERDAALEEAHDALRSNSSVREKNNARTAIEAALPRLQKTISERPIMSNCQSCGDEIDPEHDVCPSCCDDHDFAFDTVIGESVCLNCGKTASAEFRQDQPGDDLP